MKPVPVSEGAWPGAAHANIRAWRELRVLWGIVALAILALAPFGAELRRLIPFGCPFRALTGYPCPTCGATRSALLLSHFDFVGALSRFPLPTLAWVFLVGGGLLAGLSVLLRIDVPAPPQTLARWQAWLLVLALLANWAYSIATGV